jgi:plasmid stabilization system protein ParE
MPDSYRVNYSKVAGDDLQEIFDYIRQSSPQNADSVLKTIVDEIEGLKTLPHRFPLKTSVKKRGRNYRMMPVPPFVVRYDINESTRTVLVLTVRRGTRNSKF